MSQTPDVTSFFFLDLFFFFFWKAAKTQSPNQSFTMHSHQSTSPGDLAVQQKLSTYLWILAIWWIFNALEVDFESQLFFYSFKQRTVNKLGILNERGTCIMGICQDKIDGSNHFRANVSLKQFPVRYKGAKWACLPPLFPSFYSGWQLVTCRQLSWHPHWKINGSLFDLKPGWLAWISSVGS